MGTTRVTVLDDVVTYWIEAFVPARLAYDLTYIEALHQRLVDLMEAQGFTVVDPPQSRVMEQQSSETYVPTRPGYATVEAVVRVREFDVPVEISDSVDVRIEAPVATLYGSE